MSKSKRDSISSFKSVDEFQDFFDTHDLTDYEDVLKEVELEFSPKKTRHINLFQIAPLRNFFRLLPPTPDT